MPTPRSSATCLRVSPLVSAIRTAFWRNSSVRFSPIVSRLGVAFGEACLFQAVFLLGPRIATIIFSLHSPITAFVGARLFNETVSPLALLGIVVAVTGVLLAIIFKSASEKAGGIWGDPKHLGRGLVLAGLAVAFQVGGALLSKDAVSVVDPFFASFVRTASAAVAFLPVFLIFRERQKTVTSGALKVVGYSALISTVGGMTFLLAAFANTEIFRAVVISSMAPVVYIVLMSIIARERFPAMAWVGTFMAVGGVAMTL